MSSLTEINDETKQEGNERTTETKQRLKYKINKEN
jgi:hypothetical protein